MRNKMVIYEKDLLKQLRESKFLNQIVYNPFYVYARFNVINSNLIIDYLQKETDIYLNFYNPKPPLRKTDILTINEKIKIDDFLSLVEYPELKKVLLFNLDILL